MKILCVCANGNVRSVALARLLKKRHHEAIGVGLKQYSLVLLLASWAERIYAMDDVIAARLHEILPADQAALVSLRYDIGPDDWKISDHPDLLRRLRDMVEADPPS